MRRISLFSLALILAWSSAAHAERVRGYKRQDGTLVQSYSRTEANDRLFDNYSSKGNYSPNTGREGSRDPYAIQPIGDTSYSTGSSRRSRKNNGW